MNHNTINPNMHFLFEQPEEQAKDINKKIQELMINCLDIDEIQQIIKEKYGNGEEFFEYTYLNDLINCLTTNDYEFGEDILLIEMKKLLDVKSVTDLIDGKYAIDTRDGKISFKTISSFLENNLEKEKLQNEEFLKKYIDTIKKREKRIHKCHELSINAAILFEKYLKINSTLVTGYNSFYVPDNKYMHSWLEIEVNGQTLVIDSTSNIVMNKEGYYLLRQIKEDELISKITSQKIIEDKKQYGEFLDKLDLKTYLTTRDEIIANLEKNKSHFNNGDER